MNHKVFEAIERYKMIEQGDSVCVALSGGADSVALLAFLWENREKLGISVLACHLNHNLRGEESDRDEAFVRALCEKLGIPLLTGSLPVGQLARERRLSVEECGRQLRYEFFSRIAEEHNCKIATAHTLSDSMETVIFNLARGTGVRGLQGIPPVREQLIRPLIGCTRREVEEYCEKRGLAYVTDSTNLSDDYTRNAIRHHVTPQLYAINPAADRAFLRMIRTMEETDALVDSLARKAQDDLGTKEGYCRAGFLTLPQAVQHRMLSNLAAQRGIELSAESFERCLGHLRRGSGAQQLSGQVIFQVSGDVFSLRALEAALPAVDFTRVLDRLGEEKKVCVPLDQKRTIRLELLECEQIKNFDEIKSKGLKNLLDYDRIYGIVIIRPRLPGDQLRLVGRGCTKMLKKLYQERPVPPLERDRLVVLQDDRGVLWVESFGPDERVAVTGETTQVLSITILED